MAVGDTATAFATVINTSTTTDGVNCGISPLTPMAGAFRYRTTDAQNQPTGTPDTGAAIPASNGSQSFLFAITPEAPIPPTDIELRFGCDNLPGADLTLGLNTLLLSAAATPVPDIVALAATPDNDGTAKLANSGAFAVATVNVGVQGRLTATADTGAATVPLVMSICETDPVTGSCVVAPALAATGVTTTVGAGATPTFAVFATATDTIAADPANTRIFVRFTDTTGVVRGATSVAVQTVPGEASAVGDVIVDPPTMTALGFSVPMEGDDDYDAVASVGYRESGATEWQAAMPLLRVRPEWTSLEDPPEDYGHAGPGEQFAGSVFGLTPGTEYEVSITVADPDGGDRTQTVTVATRETPRRDPQAPSPVNVTNAAELQAALDVAAAGDVIQLDAGTYPGRFVLSGRSGTPGNPIVIRGLGDATVIDADGQMNGVVVDQASWVHVEALKIVNVNVDVDGAGRFAVQLSDGIGLVARELIIEGDGGIDATRGLNRDFTICDNTMVGPNVWPSIAVGGNVNAKGFIAIGVAGQGHVVCHNSVTGYGSSMFVEMRNPAQPNLAIDFHNNDIYASADDGIELDGSMRNVRVWQNRITNVLMGMSFQPVWGGPIYAIRNVIYNPAAAPFKLNNDPSGVMLIHNTIFRYGEDDIYGPYHGNAWPQLGEPANYAANVTVANNLFVGNDDALFIRQDMPLLTLDYNAYWPNGDFSLQIDGTLSTSSNLTEFVTATGFEPNGVVLTQPIFAVSPAPAADYMPLAPRLDFTLHDDASATDVALRLPNINDGFVGDGPDMGAVETGAQSTLYGPRNTGDE